MTYSTRIGVFACECGGEIAGVVDIDDLLKKSSGRDGVILHEKIPYGCTPEGESEIQRQIEKKSLNRVVLLGCSPRIMEKRFRKTCSEAGLNPALLEIVNLRDHCTWVHQADSEAANAKAKDLTGLGISRAQHLLPIEPVTTKVRRNAAVIGGGIAGMTSALSLAEHGIEVTVVEKEEDLGRFPWNDANVAKKLADRVEKSKNIKILKDAVPRKLEGTYGDYKIHLKVGNRSRKITCSAIILAVGAREHKPDGTYGYGENDRVITQLELSTRLAGKMSLDDIDHVVMIQCVGARNEERPYCGRICCISAVENAMTLKSQKKDLSVTILHRGFPENPGPDEQILNTARELGIDFIRFSEETPPKVTSSLVSGKSKEGKSFRLHYDLISLSTPPVPCSASSDVGNLFGIPLDGFGFLSEARPRLKPHQYVQSLIHVAGNARWPCTTSEAVSQAYAKSAQIASILEKGDIASSHPRATVDRQLCRGCSTCLEWCPFDVPVMVKGSNDETISFIDPFLCTGCGICAVHCPTGAATVDNLSDEIYYAMIEDLVSRREISQVSAVAFLCDWSGYAAGDLAGVRRQVFPREVIPIRIPCAGRISTGLILHALGAGADGILVYACKEGDCRFLEGNSSCSSAAADTRRLMSLLGISDTRFQMIHIDPEHDGKFCKTAEDFVTQLKNLERSPLHLSPTKKGKLETVK